MSDKKEMKRLENLIDDIYTKGPSLQTKMTCKCVCCKIAMPQLNYCEFVNIVTSFWNNMGSHEKAELICKCLEYFFHYEFEKWGIETLVKPCVFLDKETEKCKIYEKRPLSCRMYGLWPKEEYEARVNRFVKAYSKYGLKREDLPNHKQCPLVTRTDDSKELTTEVIDGMYKQLDNLDQKIAGFTDLQVKTRDNYRTFHDWLLYSIFGSQWLASLSSFMKVASRDVIDDQLRALKEVIHSELEKDGDRFNPQVGD